MTETSVRNHWPSQMSAEIINLLSDRLSGFDDLRSGALESTKAFFLDMIRELAVDIEPVQFITSNGEEAWRQFFEDIEKFYPNPAHRREVYERPLTILIIYLGVVFSEWLLMYFKQRASTRFWRNARTRMTEFLNGLCNEIQANFDNLTTQQIFDLQHFMRSYIQPE